MNKRFKYRWAHFSISSGLSIIITLFFSTYISIPSSLLIGSTLLFIFLRGFQYGIEFEEDSLPRKRLWKGLAIYFTCIILFNISGTTSVYSPILTVAAFTYVVLLLFYSNSESLRESHTFNGEPSKVPRKTKQKNQFILVLFTSFLFFIVFGQYLNQILYYFRQLAGAFFYWISTFMQYDNPITIGEREEEREEIVFEGDNDQIDPSYAWADILMYIIATVVILFVLYLIFKNSNKLKKWLSEFLTRLTDRADTKTDSYQEEKESLFNFKKWRNAFKNKSLHWLKKTFTRRKTIDDFATNQGKIRFLYQKFIGMEQKKGLSIRKDHTASELIKKVESEENKITNKEFALLDEQYNHARYSEEDDSDFAVDDLNNWINKRN